MGLVGRDGGMDAMGLHWGARQPHRWTFGSPARTRFLVALYGLQARLEQLDPRCMIKGLDRLPDLFAACWAGEFGHDTSLYIEAVRALKAQTSIVKVPEDRPAPEVKR